MESFVSNPLLPLSSGGRSLLSSKDTLTSLKMTNFAEKLYFAGDLTFFMDRQESGVGMDFPTRAVSREDKRLEET